MLPKDAGIPVQVVEGWNAACRLFIHVMQCPDASEEMVAEAGMLFDEAKSDYENHASIRETLS